MYFLRANKTNVRALSIIVLAANSTFPEQFCKRVQPSHRYATFYRDKLLLILRAWLWTGLACYIFSPTDINFNCEEISL